jgi:hypothetical protein
MPTGLACCGVYRADGERLQDGSVGGGTVPMIALGSP